MRRRNVAIVGAGVSGLLACKYALSKGYNPVVFESSGSLGGVWTKTFEITRLQTSKSTYRFTDFPWPSSVEDTFPKAEQVLEYIHAYAQHFDLIRYIRFNSKVVSMRYEGPDEEMETWDLWGGNGEAFSSSTSNSVWSLKVVDLLQTPQSIEMVEADFVVLCIGKFSGVPSIPDDVFPEIFNGKVMHSVEYAELDNQSARDLIKGKRVVVVGSLKSALDVAMECSVANGKENPCMMVIRNPHWTIPYNYSWNGVLSFLYRNRFSELLVHKPGEGLCLSMISTILSPIRWVLSKLVETDLKYREGIHSLGMVPNHSLLEEVNSCMIATTPQGFWQSVHRGEIIFHKSPNFHFCEKGIVLNDGQKILEADLVILATGFKGEKKLKDIFDSPKFQHLIMGSPHSSIPLYRQCIHPRIPQLAIIGFSESVSNLYTSELRCRWLAELLDGTFNLPRIKDMEQEISGWDNFFKTYAPNHYRRACIGQLQNWYNDQLCTDIGINPRRKKGFLNDLFIPYTPLDYAHS